MTWFRTRERIEKEALRSEIRARGIDVVGFAAVSELDERLPAASRPSALVEGMSTFIVLGKRILLGVIASRHLASKQLAGGRSLRALELAAERTALSLERRGWVSAPIPSLTLDFDGRGPHDLTPAGQGSLLVRHAAVEAGLGTWGLNLMVLTPEYGPRLYLAGVMTEMAVERDPRLEDDLCPGLEDCGRCAAVCPEDAIPRRAPVAADLEQYRGLDCAACARSCQPFGFEAFSDHAAHVVGRRQPEEMWGRLRTRKTGEVWAEMAMMKEASVTGCSECMQVCPVGEDWQEVRALPHRRNDLPGGVTRSVSSGWVEVTHVGPQVRRKTTWGEGDGS